AARERPGLPFERNRLRVAERERFGQGLRQRLRAEGSARRFGGNRAAARENAFSGRPRRRKPLALRGAARRRGRADLRQGPAAKIGERQRKDERGHDGQFLAGVHLFAGRGATADREAATRLYAPRHRSYSKKAAAPHRARLLEKRSLGWPTTRIRRALPPLP